MKKVLSILLAVCMSISLASCKKAPAGADVAKENKDEKTTVAELDQGVNSDPEEFYKKMTESTSRPVAVMIDNDSWQARPQSGLEDAFAIYEMKVEGIASRMMALFLDSDTEKVGPVRSSRHYFLDYALENDAIYAHCGFSPQAQSDISSMGVNNINEMYSNNGSNFFRDKSKKKPHNLYTSIPELVNYSESIGYETETEKERVFSYEKNDTDISGETTESVSVPYHDSYVVSYKYNKEDKVYERYINDEEDISESSGKIMTAKNIIVYQVPCRIIDDVGRYEVYNIGSGEGYFITNGKSVPITWSKTSRRGQTVYETEDGEILKLNPGNVFVHIIPDVEEFTLD